MVDNKLSETDINNRLHYNSNNIISIKDPVLENVQVDRKSQKALLLPMLDIVCGIKPLFFVFLVVVAYIEDGNDGCNEDGDDRFIEFKDDGCTEDSDDDMKMGADLYHWCLLVENNEIIKKCREVWIKLKILLNNSILMQIMIVSI